MFELPEWTRPLLSAAILAAAPVLGWSAETPDDACRSNPPGLQTSAMVSSGFAVLYRDAGSEREFVQLQYIFTDRLYYRYSDRLWRAVYLAHPSAIYEGGEGARDLICAYVAGFPIDGSEPGPIDWLPLGEAKFIETP